MKSKNNNDTLLKIFAIVLAILLWIFVHTQDIESMIQKCNFSITNTYGNIISTAKQNTL